MQTHADKCAAIRSLLPLLVEHLDSLPMRLKVSGGNGGGGGLHCDGRCAACDWNASCRGEWWEVEREQLERRYRLKAIRISLRLLEYANATQYAAIQVCYVEPIEADWYNLDGVWFRIAEDGIRWMAGEIPGDVPAWGEKRLSLHEQIAVKRADGLSIRQIARSLGVKKHVVESLLDVRRESIASAVS